MEELKDEAFAEFKTWAIKQLPGGEVLAAGKDALDKGIKGLKGLFKWN